MDHLKTWRGDLAKKHAARAAPDDEQRLLDWAGDLAKKDLSPAARVALAQRDELLELDLPALGFHAAQPFQAHDLLSGARFLWQSARNFVRLDPEQGPAHVLRMRRRVRSERDFDYFQ